MFSEEQLETLADAIQAALMLAYNNGSCVGRGRSGSFRVVCVVRRGVCAGVGPGWDRSGGGPGVLVGFFFR